MLDIHAIASKVCFGERQDAYKGYHQFREEAYNGYQIFEVYKRRDVWYWSEFDDYSGAHVGFESGPFLTSQEAYRDAIKSQSS